MRVQSGNGFSLAAGEGRLRLPGLEEIFVLPAGLCKLPGVEMWKEFSLHGFLTPF